MTRRLLGGPESSCPLAVDLDSDGRAEVVAAGTGAMPPLPGYRGVRLLDGLTGKTRWTRPMRPDTKAPDGVVDVIAAPDLDGDGTREVIAVSLFKGKNPAPAPRTGPEEPERVYVDALSGKNGLPLWWWSADLPFPGDSRDSGNRNGGAGGPMVGRCSPCPWGADTPKRWRPAFHLRT